MKKILSFLFTSLILTGLTYAQKWEYAFGSLKGNINTNKNTSVIISKDAPHKLLPVADESQTIRFRVGNNKESNGGFEIVNSGTTFGTGGKLVMTSPQGTSTNKFSIIGINGTSVFTIGFHIKFDSGEKGTYKFAIGKDSGKINELGNGNTPFSSAYNFSPTAKLPTFLIMQWDISKAGYNLLIQQKDKGLVPIDLVLNPSISFVNRKEYRVQLYANNTNGITKYFHSGKEYDIAAGASQIWINGNLVLKSKGEPNFITSELAADEEINAFTFLGSGTDSAKAYFDDFVYSNYLGKNNTAGKSSQKGNKSNKESDLDPTWGVGSIESYKKTAALFSKTATTKSSELKILSCNVLKGFSGDAAVEQSFQEWVNERKPDVVAIQELNGFTQSKLERFASRMGFPYAVIHKEEGYPLGLISKYPINNVKKITEGMRHGILYGKILDYNFIITHLVSYTYQQRIQEIDNVLLKLINEIPKEEKIIMMGDFNNMSPEDKQYYDNNPAKIQLLVNSERNNPGNTYLNQGKIDYTVVQKLLDAGFYDTYKIFNKNYDKSAPTKIKNHNNYTRIDYIWVNKYAKPDCLDMFIVKDDFTDYMSDHYPTLLILKK